MWLDIFSTLSFQGVSGPDYLQWFLTAFIVSVLGVMLVRRISQGKITQHTLSPYELAYLNGQEPLLAAVVVSDLLAKKKVALDSNGYLDPSSFRSDPTEPPFVREIVESSPKTSIHWPKNLNDKPGVVALKRRLLNLDLLRTPSARRLDMIVSKLPFVILTQLGIIRLIHGISNDKPVLFLVISLILVFLTELLLSKQARSHLTRSAKANLQALQKNQAHLLVTSKDQLPLLSQEQVTLGLSLGLISSYYLQGDLLPESITQSLGTISPLVTPVSSHTSSGDSSFHHNDCSSTSSDASDSGSGCGGCSSD